MVKRGRSWNLIPGIVKSLRPLMARELEKQVKDAHDQMIRNWEQGKDAKGRAWEPNAPSTLRQKRGSTPLIDTEAMIDSAGYEVSKSNLTAQIYVDDDKILLHEKGTERIPRRPVLGPTLDYLDDDIDSVVGKGLDMAIKGSSGGGAMVSVGPSGGR